ncbi:MAG: hypothetical protein JWM68_3955 [Verrucomicrobiales bacterium]|nr:hypothetical protein [Verrucomicrobiales bacterium]
MNEDSQLLRAYAEDHSEEAFRKLVERYVGLVYSVALRCVAGEISLAEDVTQTVFVDLARKARIVPLDVVLGGWLHHHTFYLSSRAVRTEQRRRVREKTAVEMSELNQEGSETWACLAPVLDEALDGLSASDRNAIVLRFYNGENLRTVGIALGVSEDTAQKRIARALEKLRTLLMRRGVALTLSSAGLSSLLASNAVAAAPETVVSSAVTAGLLAAKAAGASSFTFYSFMTYTKLKIAGGLIILAGVGTTLVLQHHSQTKLRADNLILQQRVEKLGKENQELTARASSKNARIAVENVDLGKKRLSLAEIPAAIQTALQKPFSQHAEAFKEIIAAVETSDFPQVVAMLEKSPNFEVKNALRSLFLTRWAETDPQSAMAAANATVSESEKREAILAVAKAWAKTDLASALAWGEKLPAGYNRNDVFQKMITGVAETDPRNAADLALRLPGRWKLFTVEKVAAQWVQMDPDAALAWVKSLTAGEVKIRALSAVSQKLAQANPQVSAELASSLPAGLGIRFLSEIASAWAERDLPATIAWARQLTDNDRRNAFQSIAQQWVAQDPEAAASYMLKSQNDSFYTVGREWGKNDPQAAMNWAKQQTDDKARDSIYKAIISGWAVNSPSDAASYVASLPAGPFQNSAASSVASNWAENDPAAAASWAVGIPEGDARKVAFQNVVLQWGRSDPEATAQWLENLPSGDSRDTAVVTFAADCLKDYAPATALKWAQTITSDGVRNNTTLNIAREWLKSDPTTAKQWIASSTLPGGIKEGLFPR